MTTLAETKIRSHVRTKLIEEQKTLLKDKLQEKLDEVRLRRTIRKAIRESKQYTTHEFTGINVLQDLLKQIVPILEKEYKKLTTSDIQRKSFRAHILRGVQNLLANPEVYFNAGKGGVKPQPNMQQPAAPQQKAPLGKPKELEEGDDGKPDTNPNFIDIGDKTKAPEPKKPEDAFENLPGEDSTGRNFALQAFQKVQKQILEEYSMLDSDEDRDLFYEYLLTNLNLYFDKFEDEISDAPPSPTTPEYEAQKQKMNSNVAGRM